MAASPTKIKAGKPLEINSSKGTMKALMRAHAALTTSYLALLAKLDGDAGVTSTDYAATLTPIPRVVP